MRKRKTLPPLHEQLRKIVLEYGTDLATNTKRCDAFLSDLITGHEYAKTLLVRGVANGLPQTFLERPDTLPVQTKTSAEYTNTEYQWLVDVWYYAITGNHLARQSILYRYYKPILLTSSVGFLLLYLSNIEGYLHYPTPKQSMASMPIKTPDNSKHPRAVQTDIPYSQIQLSIKEILRLSQSLARAKRKLIASRHGLSSLNDLSTVSSDPFYQQEKSTVILQINRLEKNLEQLSRQYATQLQKLCSIRESEVQTAMQAVLNKHQQTTHFEKMSRETLEQQLRQCHAPKG